MRRTQTIAIFLAALLLLLPLYGCTRENASTTSAFEPIITREELKEQVEKGEIPGIPIKLNQSVQSVKEYYHYGDPAYGYEGTTAAGASTATTADEEVDFLTIVEMDGYNKLLAGDAGYCYKTDREADGISAVVSFSEAYGFATSLSTEQEVEQSLGTADEILDSPGKSDLFFIIGQPQNAKLIRYSFGNHRVDFLMVDGMLSAVALINTETWGK